MHKLFLKFVFIGIDGSRAFVTGKFDKDLNDIIDDLIDSQIGDIFDWQSFYDKSYKYIGKLIGRFYNADGKPTQYLEKAEEALSRHQKVR
jgi:hypothetical protein